MSRLETRLTNQILLELGKDPALRLFRNATSKAFVGHLLQVVQEPGPIVLPVGAHVLAPGCRRILSGLYVGSSDIIGIQGPVGRFVAIEVKAGKTREAKHQKRFIEMVRELGGLAGFARDVDEAKAIVEGH